MTSMLSWVDANKILSPSSYTRAIEALEIALAEGLDPSSSPLRTVVKVARGELLLMPAETSDKVGIKVGTVAPGNAVRGLPRIQALYLVFDSLTLTPVALLDGTALTTLRTPALSAVAARHLATPEAAKLVVFGTGPQAHGHAQALSVVRSLSDIVVVPRSAQNPKAANLVAQLRCEGFPARVGSVDDISSADIIVCATTSRTPMFSSLQVTDSAMVIAVGSHEPDARELDTEFVARSQIVVEDVATARREAGDIVMAESEVGLLQVSELGEIIRRQISVNFLCPRFFKSVGMGWEDLVVAQECLRHLGVGSERGYSQSRV